MSTPHVETTREKVDIAVKYLRWGWSVVLCLVMATAYSVNTLSDVRSSIRTIDNGGSSALGTFLEDEQRYRAKSDERWAEIRERLARIEARLLK